MSGASLPPADGGLDATPRPGEGRPRAPGPPLEGKERARHSPEGRRRRKQRARGPGAERRSQGPQSGRPAFCCLKRGFGSPCEGRLADPRVRGYLSSGSGVRRLSAGRGPGEVGTSSERRRAARRGARGGFERPGSPARRLSASYLVDPASSHMLVSKIKPCMCKYKPS